MNLLTFDIEDWYHINYPFTDFELFDRQEDHRSLVDRLRGILDALPRVSGEGDLLCPGAAVGEAPPDR